MYTHIYLTQDAAAEKSIKHGTYDLGSRIPWVGVGITAWQEIGRGASHI